jgi:rod shape determining protein RodA
MGIIVMQSETGSALVYVGLIFMLYREGLSGWIIVMIGLAILLFILTLTDSAFLALTVLLAAGTLCVCLYSGRGKWWTFLGIPLLAAIAFLPEYMSVDSATKVVLGIFAVFLLVSAYLSFRERNRFTQFSIIAVVAGIILVFSVDYIFENVLQEHQRNRIEILLGIREDTVGDGFNVERSKIAIAAGGVTGAGYMNGTETQLKNVPEQSTDFIFCTIAEEWGFIGGTFVIILYVLLIWRIIHNAERSREAFTRIYGYCVASCIFMHLFVNIGMTLGIMPVIGIPPPLVSYGGSSLWAFTIMIFIFIALDRNERKYF